MEPSYFEGDRVLTFNWGKIYKGNVVVYEDPNYNLSFWGVKRLQNPFRFEADSGLARMTSPEKIKYFIKRIDKIQGGQIFVSGDNKSFSSKVGPITQEEIMGKVIWKY